MTSTSITMMEFIFILFCCLRLVCKSEECPIVFAVASNKLSQSSNFRFNQVNSSVKTEKIDSLLSSISNIVSELSSSNPKNEVPKNFNSYVDESIKQSKKKIMAKIINYNQNAELENTILPIAVERLKKYWYIGQCRRNYTNPCPKDWMLSETEPKICYPPDSYQGPCSSQNFTDSDFKREDFAWRCGISWPCINSPERDFSKCPYGWTRPGKSLCIAPSEYKGKCSPAMDFTNFTNYDKALWGYKCNIEWRAKNTVSSVGIKKGVVAPLMTSASIRNGPVDEGGNIVSDELE